MSTCCVWMSRGALSPCLLCGRFCRNIWHCCPHKTDMHKLMQRHLLIHEDHIQTALKILYNKSHPHPTGSSLQYTQRVNTKLAALEYSGPNLRGIWNICWIPQYLLLITLENKLPLPSTCKLNLFYVNVGQFRSLGGLCSLAFEGHGGKLVKSFLFGFTIGGVFRNPAIFGAHAFFSQLVEVEASCKHNVYISPFIIIWPTCWTQSGIYTSSSTEQHLVNLRPTFFELCFQFLPTRYQAL